MEVFEMLKISSFTLEVKVNSKSQPGFTCSKLRRSSGVFIINFEHISQLVLVFLLLSLIM